MRRTLRCAMWTALGLLGAIVAAPILFIAWPLVMMLTMPLLAIGVIAALLYCATHYA